MEENKLLAVDHDIEVDVDPNTIKPTKEEKEFIANDAGDLIPKPEAPKEYPESRFIGGVTDPHKRNPTGRNGMTEKQELMWTIYMRLWREGRPNVKAAGLAAGYAENTAKNLACMKWFKDRKAKLKRHSMFTRAENNIAKILAEEYATMQLQDDGSQKRVIDKDTLKVVADISKTVVTTLGKDEGWSTKTEVSGNMGGNINIKSISYADPIEIEAKVVDVITEQVDSGIKEMVTEAIKPDEEKQD